LCGAVAVPARAAPARSRRAGGAAQLFFAPTRLTLRRAVGVDASNAADGADGGVLFDLRALSLCARGRLPAR
jgi:hypothetical protein